MDLQGQWAKALRYTEIIRPRIQALSTYSATDLPYIFLAESKINYGDSVVRKGHVTVEKPALLLPQGLPRFEGFEGEENQPPPSLDRFANFLIIRGVSFPSLQYHHKTDSLAIHEGKLKEAIPFYLHALEREENVTTGLVVGPEDLWQLSVLIYICSASLRSAENDLRRLMEGYRKDLS